MWQHKIQINWDISTWSRLYISVQEECISLLSTTLWPRQWYPGNSGLKVLFKVQWLCRALLWVISAPCQLLVCNSKSTRPVLHDSQRKDQTFLNALGASWLCWDSFTLWRSTGEGFGVHLPLYALVTPPFFCSRGCEDFDPTAQSICQHHNPHVVSG